ncbi:hypothetical protein ACFLS5_03585 [Candidatus Bipolaricaulota bacterium]
MRIETQSTWKHGIRPGSTQVPNEIFDDIMPGLDDTELRVLLVINRQTLGWVENKCTGARKLFDWI